MPLSAPELYNAVLEATQSLQDATKVLEDTKRSHRNQMIAVMVAVLMFATLGFLGYQESREADRENCLAVAQGRQDLTKVLLIIVESGADRRTPEEQERTEALFEKIVGEALPPVDCSHI